MTDRLALSVQEVAESLGVGRDCIYRAVDKGEIPSVKVGTRVLIPRVWLERLFVESSAAMPDVSDASHIGTADPTSAEWPPTATQTHDPTTTFAGGTPGESTVHSKTG